MDRLLIHIGYRKAASKALQDQLSAQPSGPFPVPAAARHMRVHRFVALPPMNFDADSARAHFVPRLDASAKLGRTALLSHERIWDYPSSGGFGAAIIADRLHQTLPQTRMLVAVCQKPGNIAAIYSQYVTDGGDLSLKDCLAKPDLYLKRMPCFQDEVCRYHGPADRYRQPRVTERLLRSPFELLIARRDDVIRQMFAFACQPPRPAVLRRWNPRRASGFQPVQRMTNRDVSGNALSPPRPARNRLHRQFGTLSRHLSPGLTAWAGRGRYGRAKRQIQTRFAGRFPESSVVPSQMIDCDPGEFGYQLPPPMQAARAPVVEDDQQDARYDLLSSC